MPTIRTRPENLPTGLLLAGTGGFLDAYTFVGRGGVFANAQTGNIVLLAVAAGERHWQAALLHVPPILAFMLGVALAETLARPAARRTVRRPARFVLVAEIVVLVIVGALPAQVPNQVVTAAIAFTSAPQISTFRSLQGIDYSTALTTSNLRTLVAKAYRWRADHDATAGRQAARIAAVVTGLRRRRSRGSPMHLFFWSMCGVGGSGHAGSRARRHHHGNRDPLPARGGWRSSLKGRAGRPLSGHGT
jgi:uncharacterized membrane protein YoaK (UPF0700 family)